MDMILAVDTSVEVHARQAAEWTKFSIRSRRVDNMHEAIALLTHGEKFLFIAINEDTIPDFKTQLPIMRDITNTSIFVITSSYTIDKKVSAMILGADVYDPFTAYIKDNVLAALEILKMQNRWASRPAEPLPVLVCGDVILSQTRRSVFAKDTEVTLSKKEFDILCYFMNNRGILLKHEQLLDHLWGIDNDKAAADVIWTHIRRIRKKFAGISPQHENMIENIHGVGYRFTL